MMLVITSLILNLIEQGATPLVNPLTAVGLLDETRMTLYACQTIPIHDCGEPLVELAQIDGQGHRHKKIPLTTS